MQQAHPLGTLAHLWRYPVKSLGPEALEDVRIDSRGLEGDRQSAFFVTSFEHARQGKTYRGKEHNLLHMTSNAERARSLAAERGVAVERRDEGPYFDLGTVSVLLDVWLAELERSLGLRLEAQRFRPNFFVHASDGFDARETELVGATLRAGDVLLRVSEPIERCVTPTYDLRTGESNPEILRTIAFERGNIMGLYCDVLVPGIVSVGMPLEYRAAEDVSLAGS